MPTVLIVGGADTGRAPMATALLRRVLAARSYHWEVESVGVLGHDGAEAETEARDTMIHMGLDIDEHRARSISDEIVEQAALIVAIDSGTARVVRARFPAAAARAFGLGELAGRPRDIPDPFRMQIGAWMTYAREIAGMIEAALPRIAELMPTTADERTGGKGVRLNTHTNAPTTNDEGGLSSTASASINTVEVKTGQGTPAQGISTERAAAVARLVQLFQVAAQMPGVVDWTAARGRIEPDLAVMAAPAAPDDLAAAYVGLLRAALALLPAAPSAGQLAALQQAAERLNRPIGQSDLTDLSARLATLPTLA